MLNKSNSLKIKSQPIEHLMKLVTCLDDQSMYSIVILECWNHRKEAKQAETCKMYAKSGKRIDLTVLNKSNSLKIKSQPIDHLMKLVTCLDDQSMYSIVILECWNHRKDAKQAETCKMYAKSGKRIDLTVLNKSNSFKIKSQPIDHLMKLVTCLDDQSMYSIVILECWNHRKEAQQSETCKKLAKSGKRIDLTVLNKSNSLKIKSQPIDHLMKLVTCL